MSYTRMVHLPWGRVGRCRTPGWRWRRWPLRTLWRSRPWVAAAASESPPSNPSTSGRPTGPPNLRVEKGRILGYFPFEWMLKRCKQWRNFCTGDCARVAPEVDLGECTLHSPPQKSKEGRTHSSFETQRRRHQKSKIGLPVAPKRTCVR